jgi:hypothetical protein
MRAYYELLSEYSPWWTEESHENGVMIIGSLDEIDRGNLLSAGPHVPAVLNGAHSRSALVQTGVAPLSFSLMTGLRWVHLIPRYPARLTAAFNSCGYEAYMLNTTHTFS